MRTRIHNIKTTSEKPGFTIIEVMLVLAISGLLLIGVLTGTYRSIGQQRYNDAVRGIAEYLRSMYSAVMSPESFGGTNTSTSFGSSDEVAIYGKVLVFGSIDEDPRIYSATLVGDTSIPAAKDNFLDELRDVNSQLFCGRMNGDEVVLGTSVSSYLPLWESSITNTNGDRFKGTMIIARAPTTGIIHTAFLSGKTFDLANECDPRNDAASTSFSQALQNKTEFDFRYDENVQICVQSEDSNIIREIDVYADGHNTSAVNILDAEASKCQHK